MNFPKKLIILFLLLRISLIDTNRATYPLFRSFHVTPNRAASLISPINQRFNLLERHTIRIRLYPQRSKISNLAFTATPSPPRVDNPAGMNEESPLGISVGCVSIRRMARVMNP